MEKMPTNRRIEKEVTTQYDADEFELKWDVKVCTDSGLTLPGPFESPIFVAGKDKFSWRFHLSTSSGFEAKLMLTDFGKSNPRLEVAGAEVNAFIRTRQDNDKDFTRNPFHKISLSSKLPMEVGKTTGSRYYSSSDSRDQILTVRCTVLVKYGLKHSFNPNPTQITNSENAAPFRQDMKALLASASFADLVFQTPTKKFKVHKAIVSARSPVFAAMLNSSMLESKNSIVSIVDSDDDAVAEMIQYIYTGQCSALDSHSNKDFPKILELFQLADKYQISGLKVESEIALQALITIDNAVEILSLALLHTSTNLKSAVFEFIHRNKNQILDMESFQAVVKAQPGVMLELYRAF